jgi:hypothetical protein
MQILYYEVMIDILENGINNNVDTVMFSSTTH